MCAAAPASRHGYDEMWTRSAVNMKNTLDQKAVQVIFAEQLDNTGMN